ncbi:hypothetical protein [Desulforhabdus sp. TSK]|uniref:hypothetical protein n=1 Tax=Desulforhabdus sp. TSK TaxID=2925014 RepID=UPI001FC7F5C1|nr:hypothetical protein [Desulforhabdus sp. TSK]GKT07172.1 hypothetical protein DSTSK_04770 [Desulforhabdus sp. TSK]
MPTRTVIFSLIAVLCFLYTLNLYLRGRSKRVIEGCLGLAIVVSVTVSFFVLGWKWGLLALISPFILVGLSRPLARLVARRILGYRTGVDDRQGETDVFAELAAGKSLESVMARVQKEGDARRERLSAVARKPAIASLLDRYGVSPSQFQEIFDSLWASALHDLAWEIVSQPDDLEALLKMKREGKDDLEIWAHFRGME